MAKTLLQIIQTVADELMLPRPTAALSATDNSARQLVALTRAACEELADAFNWQVLLSTTTITTVDGVSNYALPSDCLRLVSDTYWDTTAAHPVSGSETPQTWQAITQGIPQVGPYKRFRLIGNQIQITPTPDSAAVIAFNYISTKWVIGATGTEKSDFTADDDVTKFHDRLLVSLVKLKFMQAKGLDTRSVAEDFNQTFATVKSSDVPSPSIVMDGGGYRSFLLSNENFTDGNWNA